jgi:hypothetical protein
MPHLRDDWHERIKGLEREYKAVRLALDRLLIQVQEKPDILRKGDLIRIGMREAHENLEGTYIVRLFAVFEAALRSYVLATHPGGDTKAANMINQIGGRRGVGIQPRLRDQAHLVRKARNYWAHDDDEEFTDLRIGDARGHLQEYLAELPRTWP